MSRRVYEVARELNLSTKEVMERLNDAGVEVHSNFSVVDDPAYERVFGDGPSGNGSRSSGSRDAALNGRPEAREEAEALPRRIRRPRRRLGQRARDRSRASRSIVYAVSAILAFAVAAGVGAMMALMLQGGPGAPAEEEAGSAGEQGDAPEVRRAEADRAQQEEADAGQAEEAAPQQDASQQDGPQQDGGVPRLGEAEYISRVGELQGEAVEAFTDSHDRLLLYDALTAQDVDEMRANEAALAEVAREANGLAPPSDYEEQHKVFDSAVAGLHEAARMAYELANDPVAAAETGFDGYDARVDEAAGLLERSNEMLGRDHETIGDPREISPQLSATEPARGSEAAVQT